jgi:hypothetical protein
MKTNLNNVKRINCPYKSTCCNILFIEAALAFTKERASYSIIYKSLTLVPDE